MKKRYRLKKKPCILLAFSVSILFLFTFNVTSSRYMGQVEGKAEDIVAIPVISLDDPTFNYSPNDMIPGFVDESDFYVKNYDDTKNNEVLMNYDLNVQIDSIIPIKVTLIGEDGKEIELTGNKTKEFELPYINTDLDKKMTKFHIKIEWDEQYNDSKYANENIKLTIDLKATQVVEGA